MMQQRVHSETVVVLVRERKAVGLSRQLGVDPLVFAYGGQQSLGEALEAFDESKGSKAGRDGADGTGSPAVD